MKSVAIGIVSAGTGAMIAVAVMMGVLRTSSSDPVSGEQIVSLSERVQRSEDLLHKINKNISLIEQHSKLISSTAISGSSKLTMEVASSGEVNTSIKLDEKQTQLKTKATSSAIGVDEKAEKQLISRLNDAAYTSSKTMNDFMSSDEFYNLPGASRKKVVEEMVRKLNDGSINIEQFAKGVSTQK